MAGIGFELKKMFRKKGLFALVKAYGYAGIVCTGPMILGVVLLLGIRFLSLYGGASKHEIELLNCMITYTLLASLLCSNLFALVTTRYTADQFYMDKKQNILASFWGSISIELVLGCLSYGIFLHFAGIPLVYQVLCFYLFGELILVWTEINYMTAIKDYKRIMLTFLVSLASAFLVGFLLVQFTRINVITAMLLSICLGYGIMAVWFYLLLAEYFPRAETSSLAFLRWIDLYPPLLWIGLCLTIGLFGHLVIMWTSPLQVQVQGLFYGAPLYDVAALLAFFSILVTTVNFVTSVEVNFYPTYRNYFSLFNDGGSYIDIKQAEKEMYLTLIEELKYTFIKQFFTTVLFVLVGSVVFPTMKLGANEEMMGIFRVLCIGYAFYAVGNCMMLLLLYFADNRDALISCLAFMLVSCGATILLRNMDPIYAGLGFLAGGVVFAVVSMMLLRNCAKTIMYRVLCNQPLVIRENKGFFTKLSGHFERRYEKKRAERMMKKHG